MRVVPALAAVLCFVPLAAGGDIDGKVEGWSSHMGPHRAVVWLGGTQTYSGGGTQPVMAQRGGQFVPSFLVVVAGQTVSMPNQDDVAHNVYSVSPSKEFNLGYYAKGDLKSVTFDRPGMVDVLCVIHHLMAARILVVPNSHYSLVAADGTFHIHNVPGGSYTVVFWGDAQPSFSRTVAVPPGNKAVKLSLSTRLVR